jgi:two-component system chemotaxis sensor kinase CheA
MHAGDFEPEILQDFLAESGDLLDSLRRELAEPDPFTGDPDGLNRGFRALHTVKGNASFLGLSELVEVAHAAEGALDAARGGGTRLGHAEIGLLREGVGVLTIQLAEIRAGRAVLTRAPAALLDGLNAIRPGGQAGENRAADAAHSSDQTAGADAPATPGNQTVRVETVRLEALESLVREITDRADRLAAIGGPEGPADPACALDELRRAARRLRLAAARTRLQPIEHLFQRYTRLVGDLAARTGKRIRLETEGGATEVDRRVVDLLGGPLIHLLRNCADHGIETPAQRAAVGKPETGVVRLCARYDGSGVRVRIIDDGRGLDRARIGRKAVERGQCTESELACLTDEEVYRFIFGAGFSTADRVSELSGRGVGMDVVQTNIEQTLRGTIGVESEPGRGTTLTIAVPFREAIIPALLAEAAGETLVIPAEHVVDAQGRDHPNVVDARTLVASKPTAPGGGFSTLVLNAAGREVALRVCRVLGREDVIVRPCSDGPGRLPFEHTLVRDDGGPGRIVDVAALSRLADTHHARRAA